MFEDLNETRVGYYQRSLGFAEGFMKSGPLSEEEALGDSSLYAASYAFIAISLHIGIPLEEGYLLDLEVLSDEDRLVLEDLILRAWIVGSACTGLMCRIDDTLHQDAGSLSDMAVTSFWDTRENLEDLRFDAALTVCGGNQEQAETLVEEFINPRVHDPLPAKVLL